MAGGKNKIHEHPNAGKSTFRERKHDINKKGNPRFSTAFFIKNHEHVKGLTKPQYIDALSKLLELTETELKALQENPETPSWMKLTVDDLLSPKTRTKLMSEVLDRLYGKAKEEFVIKGEITHDVNLAAPIQVIIDGKPE